MWSLGRMGYSKKFPGNGDGGGLSTERLRSCNKIDLQFIDQNFHNLFKKSKTDAYSFIINCGSTPDIINDYIKKYF